jgi:hypothetical protein
MAEKKNMNTRTGVEIKNPRNKESPLYLGLTRLFSGPLANFRADSQLRFKRRDLDRFKFTSASGQSFKKKSYNPFEAIQSNIMANQSRAERYSDFDQMEFMPELASALDIYADEMTTSNHFRELIKIDCQNDEIKQILYNLYNKTLNLESNLFGWCRTMVKFGDFFMYLDIDEHLGIKGVLGLPSPEVERLEGQDETNPNYVQFQWNSAGMTFENWQVAHFRILGQDKYSPYGTSILEPARRIWRQLNLMEDAMMAYRVVRSPERRVFYIDTGNIPPQEVEQYMQKIITGLKRNQIVDPTTGRVDLRYNPMSIDEDFYIPVRGTTSGTKIENLPGGQFTSAIDDVKYLRDKLFSAIKIPQAYLARGEGASEDKSTLAQKDIRFARTIQRLQKPILSELEKIGMIHLYTLGFRNDDLIKFKLSLNNPSKIAELQELEHFKVQLEVAGTAKEQGFSKRWIFENVFKINERELIRNQRDLMYDNQFNKMLEAAQPEASGGSGGGMSSSEPSASTPATAETPAEAGEAALPAPEAGGETPEAGEEAAGPESSLLAAPAKRSDERHDHLYKPVTVDKRPQGAFTRHTRTTHSPESTSGKNSRSLFPGMSDLNTFAIGIREDVMVDYDKDEEQLLDVDKKLKALSESFNKKRKEQKNEA